jgi:hypothetical protein
MDTTYPGEPFLPHLPRLMAQLEAACKTYEERQRAVLQLQHLPYTLRGMETALEQFLITAIDVVNKHAVEGPTAIALIRPFFRDRLNLFVDLFLDTARRTQNALLPYLRRRYGIDSPNSLSEFMKRLHERPGRIPASVVGLLKDYWSSHGRRLKDYRDLAQHHALVASHARVTMALSGKPLLYLTLPNNPEEKSAIRHLYSEPTIHATEYLGVEFEALVRLCHEMVRQMIDPSTNPPRGLAFRFPEGLNLGPGAQPVGAVVPTVTEIEVRLTRLLTELNARLRPEGSA